MLYIAKSGSWVVLGQTMNSVLSLLLVIAFANLLPKETYGLYRYILSIAGILNIFTLTGMNNAVARAVARGGEDVLRPAVGYQFKWNLLMLAASYVLGGYYLSQGDQVLGTALLILGSFVPFTLAFNTYSSYLEGMKRFGLANVLSVLSTLTYSLGMLVALLLTDEVVWLIVAYTAATFIPAYVFYVYVVRRFGLGAAPDIRETEQYGRELTYLRFIDPVVSQVDKLILGSFWGAGPLAVYALASAIPARATLFIKSWVAVGFPKFAEKTFAEINQVFYRRIVQGMLIGLTATAGYIIVSPYVFTYLLPQYLESIRYSQLLAMNFIFALPNRYMSLLFTSQGLSRTLFSRTFMQSGIAVVLYVVGGIWGGVIGLVYANLLNTLIGTIINIGLWLRVSRG